MQDVSTKKHNEWNELGDEALKLVAGGGTVKVDDEGKIYIPRG